MDLTIIFIGLIIHVNQPFSFDNTAVLPSTPHHVAKMIVRREDIANPRDAWVMSVCKVDPCEIYLAGYTVTVTGTKGTFSRMSQHLIDAMPSVTTLAPKCGGLRDEVRDRRPGANEFAAFIEYRGGRRRLVETFRLKASFLAEPPWDGRRCLACAVAYEAETEDAYATLSFHSHAHGGVTELHVKQGKTITVENLDRHVTPPGQPPPPNHFGYYYRIFERTNCEQPLPQISEEECTTPYCERAGRFPQADCTNSTYP